MTSLVTSLATTYTDLLLGWQTQLKQGVLLRQDFNQNMLLLLHWEKLPNNITFEEVLNKTKYLKELIVKNKQIIQRWEEELCMF